MRAAHREERGGVSGTFLSTFSGVGGIDLGLERAGWRCVGQAEADPYRRAVLAERFPGVPCADDVRELRGWDLYRRGWFGDQPGRQWSLNLLCGGFPCQDLSVAGRRAGLDGARSGLFFAFADLAEAVRPRWILLENVPGLFSSHGGRDFGVLLGTLADLGYGVAWRVLDSRFFGVPQRRRRVFIVGCDVGGRAGAECAGQVLAIGSGCDEHFEARGEAGAGAAGGIAHCAGVTRPLTTGTGQRLDAETDDMIVVNTLDRMAGGPDDNAAQAGHLVPVTFTSRGRDGGAQTEAQTDGIHPALRSGRGGGRRDSGVALGASVRRLTPRECERLQGFPDDWTLIEWQGKPAADSHRYAACGDAVTVNVAEWIGRRLMAAHMEDMRVAA